MRISTEKLEALISEVQAELFTSNNIVSRTENPYYYN